MRVVKNPTQPGFNHYLFESVAALIKQGCARDSSMVTRLEDMLVPPFQYVLGQDVQVMMTKCGFVILQYANEDQISAYKHTDRCHAILVDLCKFLVSSHSLQGRQLYCNLDTFAHCSM